MVDAKLELQDMEKTLMKQSAMRELNLYERIFQPCVAELVGTTFFVFIGCVSVIEDMEAAGRLQPALVHGLAVAVLIACMAEIRFNCLKMYNVNVTQIMHHMKSKCIFLPETVGHISTQHSPSLCTSVVGCI